MTNKIELVYRANSPVGMLELSILSLLENGICKVVSRDKKEVTVMSVLYVFSKERIADALANLCNNEIISIDYRSKGIAYTPIFSRLLSISRGFYFGKRPEKDDKGFITDFKIKCEMLREEEPFINFSPIVNKIDFRLV